MHSSRSVVGRRTLLLAAAVIAGCAGVATETGSVEGDSSRKPTDPLFTQPYVDIDEWRDTPVRHRYVHGGFKGTETKFSFYFPPKEQYQGHFFQYITPVPDNENLAQNKTGEADSIGFSVSSGAYFVETNGGGAGAVGKPGKMMDPTIAAYRANAAAARYSRVVAAEMYGPHRTYGYCYGGSGGAYRTIGSIENTDVWDGAVPFVLGSPMAIPNVFAVRMHAMRVLQDKFPQIVDALEPGGSGDPYAGLNVEEKEALQEVTRMGFPPRSWYAWKTMGIHAFTVLYPGMSMADGKYFDDFWKVPGYLGANPPSSLLKARVQFLTTVVKPIMAADANRLRLPAGPGVGQPRGDANLGWQAALDPSGVELPVAFKLKSAPHPKQFLGGDLVIKNGEAAGKRLQIRELAGKYVLLAFRDNSVALKLKAGDQVEIDNSNFLAAQTYHRHQVPGPDYPVWNQFRDPDGKPIYPQRPMLLGPLFTRFTVGAPISGKFKGKMILVENLWDREAYPWQADWYRARVQENRGAQIDDNFRLWYTDHALHGALDNTEDRTHAVTYIGVLQQALRDLSAWVEHDVPPAMTTHYSVVDGQVVVPPTAAERNGIQPVVTLTAQGGKRIDANVKKPVSFKGVIELPPNMGTIVSAEWDFDGKGEFPEKSDIPRAQNGQIVVETTHAFARRGTYFVVLRTASQRNGDAASPYARVQNLDRVRVVVN